MEIKEIRNLSGEELKGKLEALRGELFQINFNKKVNGVDKPHKIKEIRQSIARIRTHLNKVGS